MNNVAMSLKLSLIQPYVNYGLILNAYIKQIHLEFKTQ